VPSPLRACWETQEIGRFALPSHSTPITVQKPISHLLCTSASYGRCSSTPTFVAEAPRRAQSVCAEHWVANIIERLGTTSDLYLVNALRAPSPVTWRARVTRATPAAASSEAGTSSAAAGNNGVRWANPCRAGGDFSVTGGPPSLSRPLPSMTLELKRTILGHHRRLRH
jgi:hypothetical protein